jgi:hypothetical protein
MTPEKMQLKLLNAGEEVAALTMVISSDQLEIDKFAGESLPKTHILATRNMYSVVKNTKIVPTWPRNVKTLIYHNLKKRVEIQYFELTKDLRGRGIGNVWYQSHVEPYLRRCNAPVISVFGTCLSDPLGYIFWKKQGFDQDLILNLVSSNDETQHTMLLKILPESKASEKEILAALPQEWYKNEPRAADFTAGLSEPLQIENILNPDKSTFIFSEKVTFDNGLGVLLPKLAKSGMKIAVMATTDAQRALIEELNRGKPKNERIICQATFADIRAEAKTPRYYYFKVDGDPAADMPWIMTFDISAIVKKIIDSLGKVSGIVERERLELLREAARKFAEAA